jgi:hypothetical protein
MHPESYGSASPSLVDQVKSESTMEDRLRQADQDFMESLTMLRDKLSRGGILTEMDSANLREQSPCRTPLEGAVNLMENHGWMIRDFVNAVIL